MTKHPVVITKYKYKGKVYTLKFTAGNHQYRVQRPNSDKWVLVPSVTGITGQLDKSRPLTIWAARITAEFIFKKLLDKNNKLRIAINPKHILDMAKHAHTSELSKAGDIGTKVHNLIEKYLITGTKPRVLRTNKHKDVLDTTFDAFKAWQKQAGWVRVEATEKKLYHPLLNYAGTVDIVARLKGGYAKAERTIVDIKTTNHFHSLEMSMQLIAYMDAWNIMYPKKQVKRIGIIRVNKETGAFKYYDCTPAIKSHRPLFKSLLKAKGQVLKADAAARKAGLL